MSDDIYLNAYDFIGIFQFNKIMYIVYLVLKACRYHIEAND